MPQHKAIRMGGPSVGYEVGRAARPLTASERQAQARVDLADEERLYAREQAQRAKAIRNLGATKALELEATARRLEQDKADERRIWQLKARGATAADRRIKVIRLRMTGRRNGVKV